MSWWRMRWRGLTHGLWMVTAGPWRVRRSIRADVEILVLLEDVGLDEPARALRDSILRRIVQLWY